MVAGRTTEGRAVTIGTTNASAAITFAAGVLTSEDVGRTVTGTGIPANATIATVSSSTAGTLSANATATGSPSVTLGLATAAATGYIGWSPETVAEAGTYTVAAVNAGTAAPSKVTNTYTRNDVRGRG